MGRAGLSQLTNLGFQSVAVTDDEQFIVVARRWADDLPGLGALRQTLRQRMLDSPLTDGRRFTRNIEAAYRAMWQMYCRQNEKGRRLMT